ncbi:MMPL family transporter [Hydrogenophaga aromaticivorans]|uniref:MMPL family transporter n=1 Tax=Hydrogenophaga aromaticivorans TaxID=2610898 RepID=A0A7Y8GV86_9BURK|nr:MMPL family transporter [Hydrogenophaga aromaticivorans]MBQ0917562.1 MMPL family transporter [Hydrogenophaga aromaticivorans]NWF45485.1 MMPL family transporter [Hydrogenophaga aromaticivorans]
MRSAAVRVFLVWLALMLAGVAVVWNSRFSADMSFFLPSKPSAEQQALAGQLRDGTVSRLLMVSVGGGDAVQRAAVSRELRKRLASDPAYVSVQNGEAGGLEGERDVLLRHRYRLSPAVTPERFTEEGLLSAVTDTIDLLSSPAGLLLKPYLLNDPTGEVLAVLGQLNPASQPQMREGVWASRNGERAMLLLQTRALGSDTDGQAAAIDGVRTAFAQAVQATGHAGLALQMSGPGQFAVQSRETIKNETSQLFLISMLGIAGVLLWVYRSPRLLALGLLPMLSGALAGVVVVSLVHGTVFGITMGFGTALIGEAVDYAIYFFVQSGRMGLAAWRQQFWPTVRLGVLTSALGFGALLFSGFPGLSQLGLYALTGVVTAALVTRFVLPVLAGTGFEVPAPGAWVHRVHALLGQAWRLRAAVGLLGLVTLGYLWQQRDNLWHADLSALSTVSQAEAENDARMRDDLAAPDARYLVSIHAKNPELALQAAERAGQQLDRLVEEGVIGGYDSPARFLPSAQLQQQRLASLPEAPVLQARLQAALVDSPLSASRLGPFVADVQAARTAGVMQRADLDGSALALAVDSMLMPDQDGGWNVMMPLRPAPGAPDASLPVERLRAALAGSGAVFVDLKTEFESLYGGYVGEAVRLSLLGFLAIVVLLAVTLRSPGRLLRVLLTLVITVMVVITALHLSGQRLHLLHLVGMLLTVAVGSNYALFFDRAAGGEPLDAATLMSLSVATVTTAIGFGALATSNVPVLNAIGITVGPGALMSLLLAAVLVYPKATADR